MELIDKDKFDILRTGREMHLFNGVADNTRVYQCEWCSVMSVHQNATGKIKYYIL